MSYGVEPVALVCAEDFACFEFDDFAFFFAEVTAQEVVVVNFAEKADALAVLAVGRGEVCVVCQLAHLAFHQVAYGEHSFLDLRVRELCEEVGLVFDGVFGGGEEGCAAFDARCGVVSGGDAVVVVAALVVEGTELDEAVAHHVGVGGEAFAHRLDGVAHHVVPILLVQVDLFEAAAIFLGYIGCYFDVLFCRTVDEAFFVFHTDTDIEDVGRQALLF